jgi:hypothetical protein
MRGDYFTIPAAQHGAWALRRRYRACQSLNAADSLHERASAYGSLHVPLNHTARIEGGTPPPVCPRPASRGARICRLAGCDL